MLKPKHILTLSDLQKLDNRLRDVGDELFRAHALMRCSDGCPGEFSVTPGDYFMLAPADPMVCSQCGCTMELVTKQTVYRRVKV